MKIYSISKTDGGVSIMRILNDAKEPQDEITKWPTDKQAEVVGFREIGQADIPSDREFRNAWEDAGSAVSVNMPKARQIHSTRIAVAQSAEIARLQVAEREERLKGNTTKADEHNQTRITLEALDLNTLATQIQNATTPQALSAIWPAQLPRTM